MALRKRKTELYGCNQGLIVDDHTVVRDGQSVMLENVEVFAVVGEARNGAEVVEQARQLKPSCADGPANARA